MANYHLHLQFQSKLVPILEMSPKKGKLSPASAISIEVGANFGSFCNLIAHCSPTFLPIGDTCAKLSFFFFLFLVELENRLDPHLGNLFVQINLTQAAEFEKHSTIRFHKRINATSSWGGGSGHEDLTFYICQFPFVLLAVQFHGSLTLLIFTWEKISLILKQRLLLKIKPTQVEK